MWSPNACSGCRADDRADAVRRHSRRSRLGASHEGAIDVRFAFTAEQLEFRDALRELLTKECSPAHVRDAWTNDTGRVPGLWDKLLDMGIVGVLASEAAGGLGLTFVDLVLLLEETG